MNIPHLLLALGTFESRTVECSKKNKAEQKYVLNYTCSFFKRKNHGATFSGSEYPYLYEAFGPIPAFTFSWTSTLIVKPAAVATTLLAFAAYVIEPFFPGCGEREDLILLLKLLAAAAIGKFQHFKRTQVLFVSFFKRSRPVRYI